MLVIITTTLEMIKGFSCRQLDTATNRTDVSVGRPQGKMKLWEMGPYFYRLPERAKYSTE